MLSYPPSCIPFAQHVRTLHLTAYTLASPSPDSSDCVEDPLELVLVDCADECPEVDSGVDMSELHDKLL